ncbi:MAG TPA: helix-turn-helix domain-containing protein [Streptosporangiaceae bacterium]|nr:helix-turn-helix domain-containing protein [Streptosporangiaceae bacterium]
MSQAYAYSKYEASVAPAAALMADQARAAMLLALLDGRPLAASELARLAGVGAPTASAHLAKLLDGGMVTVVRQGRHRYYQLAGHEVAVAIEALSQIAPPVQARSLRQSRQAAALAEARTCYDHLAGRAGVELLAGMLREGLLAETGRSRARSEEAGDSDWPAMDMASVNYEVTKCGVGYLVPFGIKIQEIRSSRRRFAGACLDWTQRKPHLGGALAAAITTRLFELGWIERGTRLRSVVVTPAGREGLAATFGWNGESGE